MFNRLFSKKSKDIWVNPIEIKSEKVLAAGLPENELQLIADATRYHLSSLQSKYNSKAQLIACSHFNATIYALHKMNRHDLSRLLNEEINAQLEK